MKMQRNRCPYTCLAVLALAALLLTLSGASSAAQTAGAGTINGTVSDVGQPYSRRVGDRDQHRY